MGEASRDVGGDVRAKLVAKLAAKRLPQTSTDVAWGGYGTGRLCDVCDQPVSAGQVEYEVDIADGATFRFHLSCFDVWHDELVRTGATDPPPRIAGQRARKGDSRDS